MSSPRVEIDLTEQGDKVTRWQGDKVTKWQGDKVTRWQGDKVSSTIQLYRILFTHQIYNNFLKRYLMITHRTDVPRGVFILYDHIF